MREYLKFLIVFAMVFASGSAVMTVSHRVHLEEREIAKIKKEILKAKESIRVLEAEWAYLNNPERLEYIATQYLSLTPPVNEQLASSFLILPQNQVAEEQLDSEILVRPEAQYEVISQGNLRADETGEQMTFAMNNAVSEGNR